MRAYEVAERFWQSVPCRLGARDRVAVEGSSVSYLLWGHEIARWDKKTGTLVVDDCGWRTWLTKDRLGNILREVEYDVYSNRGKWFIHDRRTDESYVWEGHHKIYLERRVVEPARPRVRRPEVSERLRAYYERARETIEARRRIYVARVLDGTVYVFVDKWLRRRRVGILVVKTHSPEFEVYRGYFSRPAIYTLFMRHALDRILNGERLEKVEEDKAEFVISTLREMNFKLEDLPDNLASALALAKLIEC